MPILQNLVGPDEDIMPFTKFKLSPGKYDKSIFEQFFFTMSRVEKLWIYALNDRGDAV
jgi:hypothetical protein